MLRLAEPELGVERREARGRANIAPGAAVALAAQHSFPKRAIEELRREVAVITYRMDHPSFQNSLLATGPESGFNASYTGWGCLSNVVVLMEYIDPDRPAEIAAYNMCQALGW